MNIDRLLRSRWGHSWPGLSSNHAPLSKPAALGLILVVWALGWGGGTVRAIHAMLDPSYRTADLAGNWPGVVDTSLTRLAVAVAVVVLCWFILKYRLNLAPHSVGLRWPRSCTSMWWFFCAAGGFVALLAISQALDGSIGVLIPGIAKPWSNAGMPPSHSAQNLVFDVVNSVAAGSEEILYTALIPLVLSAAGFRQAWVWIIAVAARLSFHLYYFPDMIWLILWAVGALVLYRLTRSLWATMATHMVYDLAVTFNAYPATSALTTVFIVILIALVVLGVVATQRLYKQAQAHQTPKPTTTE